MLFFQEKQDEFRSPDSFGRFIDVRKRLKGKGRPLAARFIVVSLHGKSCGTGRAVFVENNDLGTGIAEPLQGKHRKQR